MYVDFAIIETDLEEIKLKDQITNASHKYKVNSITVPYHLLRICKPILKKTETKIGCFIDFPLGFSDTKTRVFAAQQAIASGAQIIDISFPQILAATRKYDKVRQDIENLKSVCGNNVQLKYILEYRIFDHKCLKKICSIFDDVGIEFAMPSTGFFIDNLADNLIASSFLHQNSKELKIIATGNAWTDDHFSILNKSGIFGFRTFNIECLKNFRNFSCK